MSAYSDWKFGALSDEDYAFECWREDAIDRDLVEKEMYDETNCMYCENGICSYTKEACTGCE